MTGPRVAVRMYRQLLGDCFLIRVWHDAASASGTADAHILIDCGAIMSSPGLGLLPAVATDIAETCSRKLSLLIVTHEHYDHICGFGSESDIFFSPQFSIDELWMAWTEEPEDGEALKADLKDERRARREEARAIKAAQAEAEKAVRRAARRIRLRAAGDADDWMAGSAINGLEVFLGPDGNEAGGEFGIRPSEGGRWTNRKIMAELKAKARAVAFLEPGDVREVPGTDGIRAHALGPPRNVDRLFKDLPTKATPETYLRMKALDLGPAATERLARLAMREAAAAAVGRSLGDEGDADAARPFSRRHSRYQDGPLVAGDIGHLEALAPAMRGLVEAYSADEGRRIDRDWEAAAGLLALDLDNDTNNTSLVLAFELEPGGDVLLFAADAQVGNWESWHDQMYEDGGGARTVSAEDLLRRTILYKVGHHGSHNATLKARGLEMMKSPSLQAMVPVVEAVAATKEGWHMPYDRMFERLRQKTGERILRGDEGMPAAIESFKQRVRFQDPTNEAGSLWVELDVR